ncbi:hypothetical protein [Salipiger sp. IMCC34102]|uniref:hypothetical protein n=1 Tax=Salipiger sp. IMCC34102 TaxID=2510647 RepID=UPI001A91993B|nr:hypothetical protein [Salipiger sp. IMCC34102]
MKRNPRKAGRDHAGFRTIVSGMTNIALAHLKGRRRPSAIIAAIVWCAALGLAIGGVARGDVVLAVGALGAMVMALALPAYTRLSGIVMPAGLATGVLTFSLAAFVVGEWSGAYTWNWWWDIALHLVSAAVLALVGHALVLLVSAGAPPRTGLWIGSILAVGFAALVGAAWELMEFSIDAIFGTNAQRSGLRDTMGDVAANITGAIYGAVAGQLALKRGTRLPLSGLLLDFCNSNRLIYGAWPGVPFHQTSGQPDNDVTTRMETT